MPSREGANLNIEMDLSSLLTGVVRLDNRLDIGVAGVMEFWAPKIEGHMRTGAPWTDRTGAARSGLSAATEHKPKVSHAIHLFYRVPYGIWLEIRFAGRYSIIVPTLVEKGPAVMKTLSRLFARLGRAGGAAG